MFLQDSGLCGIRTRSLLLTGDECDSCEEHLADDLKYQWLRIVKVNTFCEGVFKKCDIRKIDKIEFGVAQ
jgi:hypothetical protein